MDRITISHIPESSHCKFEGRVMSMRFLLEMAEIGARYMHERPSMDENVTQWYFEIETQIAQAGQDLGRGCILNGDIDIAFPPALEPHSCAENINPDD